MMVTLYSTGCPRCTVLEKKLEQKKIEYSKITDVDVMLAMGIKSVPMLQIDDAAPMDYIKAVNWVKEQ